MAKIVPFDDPSDYKRSKEKIKKLWNENESETYIRPHAKKRMAERKIDILDVENVIKYGSIVEHCMNAGYWQYTLDGRSVDGRRIRVVVEIQDRLILVTVVNL